MKVTFHYDHHGLCQSHSLHEKPCPHEEAAALIAELPAEDDE